MSTGWREAVVADVTTAFHVHMRSGAGQPLSELVLRRLVDRTIVRTHVQFAVTGFGSPLIAMDWGAAVRGLSSADKS
jgi:hypothetical protein